MAVRTVLPRHAMLRGRPTLTESKRGITLFPTTTRPPQFEQVNANDKTLQEGDLQLSVMILGKPRGST
jgi:hypothetical protein